MDIKTQKIDCLRFVMCPLLALGFQGFFYVAVNSTNEAGNTKGGSITVLLTSCSTGLVCFANKNTIVSCHTADSKPVKQEVNGTMILPPLVFPVTKQSRQAVRTIN